MALSNVKAKRYTIEQLSSEGQWIALDSSDKRDRALTLAQRLHEQNEGAETRVMTPSRKITHTIEASSEWIGAYSQRVERELGITSDDSFDPSTIMSDDDAAAMDAHFAQHVADEHDAPVGVVVDSPHTTGSDELERRALSIAVEDGQLDERDAAAIATAIEQGVVSYEAAAAAVLAGASLSDVAAVARAASDELADDTHSVEQSVERVERVAREALQLDDSKLAAAVEPELVDDASKPATLVCVRCERELPSTTFPIVKSKQGKQRKTECRECRTLRSAKQLRSDGQLRGTRKSADEKRAARKLAADARVDALMSKLDASKLRAIVDADAVSA